MEAKVKHGCRTRAFSMSSTNNKKDQAIKKSPTTQVARSRTVSQLENPQIDLVSGAKGHRRDSILLNRVFRFCGNADNGTVDPLGPPLVVSSHAHVDACAQMHMHTLTHAHTHTHPVHLSARSCPQPDRPARSELIHFPVTQNSSSRFLALSRTSAPTPGLVLRTGASSGPGL